MPKEQGWQFPQGGIDLRKNLLAETRRELKEEIGTCEIALLSTSDKMYCYDVPAGRWRRGKRFKGQCHWWVVVELQDEDTSISFDNEAAEFDDFEWAYPADVLARIVEFKRHTYGEALRDLGLIGSR